MTTTMAELLNKVQAKTVQVSVAFGKANFTTAGITIAAFVVEPPFQRSLLSKKLPATGRLHSTAVGGPNDGSILAGEFHPKEGTLIAMQCRRTERGAIMADGTVFIRVRESGPLVHVLAKLPQHASNRIGSSVSIFMGRGDLLSSKEVRGLGVALPTSYVKSYMHPEEVEECFDLEELSPETSAKPVVELVTNRDGEVVALAVKPVQRRMRVRRT